MVYLKVSDGSETRKFQVNPNEVTFDQLKERLTSYFPSSLNGDLSLQYRDKDGDAITLSSNQELQEALSQLPEEAVWKLHIKSNPHSHKTHRPTQQRQRRCHNVSIFEPTLRGPFGWFHSNPWANFDREFSKTLQLARTLEHLLFNDSEKEEEKKEQEATNSENGATENKETKTSEEDPDEVVKSKSAEQTKETAAAPQEKQSEGTAHVRHWGVSEPRVVVSPWGFRTVSLGPVGYSIRWRGAGGCCGDKSKEESAAPTEKTSASQTATEEKTTTEPQATPEEPKAEATNAASE